MLLVAVAGGSLPLDGGKQEKFPGQYVVDWVQRKGCDADLSFWEITYARERDRGEGRLENRRRRKAIGVRTGQAEGPAMALNFNGEATIRLGKKIWSSSDFHHGGIGGWEDKFIITCSICGLGSQRCGCGGGSGLCELLPDPGKRKEATGGERWEKKVGGEGPGERQRQPAR